MNKYKLEAIVFLCGAIVMILEMVGSRILAPFLGTSIIVWTSLIGVILGALSLGYWSGGRIADQRPSYEKFSLIIFLGGIFIALIFFIQEPALSFISKNIENAYCDTILATVALFAMPSIILGMASPYAVKLKLKNLEKSGRTVGNLYAISTVGSIVGTFLAGFFLIPFLGSLNILIFLSLTLILTSLLSSFKKIALKILLILFLLFSLLIFQHNQKIAKAKGIVDIDTRYNRVKIMNFLDKKSEQPARGLVFSPYGIQSGMFLDSEELVFDYTKYYRLGDFFNPEIKKALMVGGAGYSYPKDFLNKHPEAKIDVIEIDPALTKLAKQYFRLQENERLNIFHEDARIFLNKNKTQYDIIYIDAFTAHASLPYHLTTLEVVEKIFNSLDPHGAVLVNIIGNLEGDNSRFLQAEYKTYKKIFPQVHIFPVKDKNNHERSQNIMLVASKNKEALNFEGANPEQKDYLKNLWEPTFSSEIPILTDDHAPVDYYTIHLTD